MIEHKNTSLAIKCVKQSYHSPNELVSMMETFRQMVNYCIKIGIENNCSTLKKLSLLSYHELSKYEILSYYKLTAISSACGRLAQRKRDIKKGKTPKSPFISKPYLVSCYGFKINNMLLAIPIGDRNYQHVLLNSHTLEILQDRSLKVKSFTITLDSISLSIRKEATQIIPENVIGIDRNLRNITTFDGTTSIMYKTNKLLSIKENTTRVISSFKRMDVRVKKSYQQRLGNRRTRRIKQHLHKISKDIVQRAVQTKSMIVLEDLKGIRKLYKCGNGQGNKYRRRLNSWSFYELQRQIQYKASWEGIPVSFIDPKRTSQLCPACGGKCQEDKFQLRKLWCTNCKKSMDRDVVASMNIAYKGWSRFCHPRGLSDEAM
ncbi:MAG: transposase, partial [Thaumarchaeota archaeon]|nr:transposase [Nitrososphaerota archaeon]